MRVVLAVALFLVGCGNTHHVQKVDCPHLDLAVRYVQQDIFTELGNVSVDRLKSIFGNYKEKGEIFKTPEMLPLLKPDLDATLANVAFCQAFLNMRKEKVLFIETRLKTGGWLLFLSGLWIFGEITAFFLNAMDDLFLNINVWMRGAFYGVLNTLPGENKALRTKMEVLHTQNKPFFERVEARNSASEEHEKILIDPDLVYRFSHYEAADLSLWELFVSAALKVLIQNNVPKLNP